MAVARSLADIHADNAELRAARDEHRAPERWVERVRERTTEGALVAIVTFKGDAHAVDGDFLFDVDVVEHVAGSAAPSSLTIRQPAEEGAPVTCGGLRAGFGGRAVVVLNPSGEPSVYDLVLDFQSGAYGWGRETAPGEFRSYEGSRLVTANVVDVTEDSP